MIEVGENSIAKRYAIELEDLFKENPDKASRSIAKFRNSAALEISSGSVYEIVPRTIYNTVGKVYPNLSRENKDICLAQIIEFLDKTDSGLPNWRDEDGLSYVNKIYTQHIREPLLLSDITIVCGGYYPGTIEGTNLKDMHKMDSTSLINSILDKNGLFKQDCVNSDYLVAIAFLGADWDGGRQYYLRANKEFLDRVVKAHCWKDFGRAVYARNIEAQIECIKKELIEEVHDKIDDALIHPDWTRIPPRPIPIESVGEKKKLIDGYDNDKGCMVVHSPKKVMKVKKSNSIN